MKRLLIIAALMVVVPVVPFVHAQSTAADGDVEQTLAKIGQELNDAWIKGDAAPLERHLADNFMLTVTDGRVVDKPGLIAFLKSGDLRVDSITVDDVKMQVVGDIAVVTSRSREEGTYKGQGFTVQNRLTDVYVKRGGHWQLVVEQGTAIGSPQAAL